MKTINNRLVPDKLAAAAWCQRQFADQSRVSEVLHRITPENLLQLEAVSQELFAQQSLARSHSPAEWLVVDIDMTGLAVSPTSKSYEGAAFGFMQKDKGKGYKLSCPYIGEEQEASKTYKSQSKKLLEQRADKLHKRAKLLQEEISQALHIANAFQCEQGRSGKLKRSL